jgi:formyl-CoA transferase
MMNEVFADPQVQHLGMAVRVPKAPGSGGVGLTLVAQPVDLSRTPSSFTRLLPDAGTDNDDILKAIGLNEDELAALRQEHVI